MRAVYAAITLGVMAACGPAIPDSGAGVGFDNSLEAQRARDVALETGKPLIIPSNAVSSEAVSAGAPLATVASTTAVASQPLAPSSSSDASDIAAEAAAAINAANGNSGSAPLQASPSNPAPIRLNNPGISNENNFGSVSGQRSISDDAERIASSRQQRQVIQPTALPTRSGSAQPNIVAYALNTSNARGSRLYSRAGINLASKSKRNCAQFSSPDQAQIAFLAKGGPKKDRQALDPDGDGYACGWDPVPYRQAVKK